MPSFGALSELPISALPVAATPPSGFISAWANNANFTVGNMKKNVAGQKVGAQLVSATDGSVFTGAVTVYVTGDAGTQAIGSVGAGACTHEGNGYHTYAPAQAETNYDLTAFTFIGTGAVAATVQVYNSFPQTVDLSTGITGGTITNVTTVNGLAAGVITATSIAADAITDAKVAADVTIASVTGSVGSVTGAVGSVTGNVGGNVTGSVGSVVGAVGSVTAMVTANTIQISGDSVAADNAESFFDGTGYAGTNNVIPTVTTLTGHTPQTGDSFARIGATGSGLTSLATQASVNTIDDFLDTEVAAIKAKTDNLPAAPAAVGDIPTAAAIADQVWDEVLSGHLTAGSTGNALNAAGAAGDPWTTTLPGAYGAGSAGYIIGNNMDAAITSRLAPTTAGRTLDVSATGEAGIDWANIGSPTTAVNLSATNIDVDQVVASVASLTVADIATAVWEEIAPVTPVDDSYGLLMTLAAERALNAYNTGLSTATAVSALPTAAQNADAVWDEVLSGHLTGGSTGNALNAAGAAGDPWSTALPGAYSAGTAGKIIGDNINATISSRASQTSVDTIDGIVDSILVDTAEIGTAGAGLTNINLPNQTMDIVGNITGNLSGSVGGVTGSVGSVVGLTAANLDVASSTLATAANLATVAGYLDTEIGAIKAKTDNLPAAPASVGDIPTVASILTTAITEAYRANGAAPTLAQFMSETLAHLGEASISGTVKTIKKLDHSTTAETFMLDSATTPTSITRAS